MSGLWRTGQVEQVDRVKRLVRGQLEHPPGQRGAFFEARYHGPPPAPLTEVRLGQLASGSFECFGQIGARDVILHEDFGFHASGGSDAWQQFDHPWILQRPSAIGSVAAQFEPTGKASVLLTTGTLTGQYVNLRRSFYGPPRFPLGSALWFSAAVRDTAGNNARIVQAALANSGGADHTFAAGGPVNDLFVGFRSHPSNSSGRWEFLAVRENVVYVQIDTGITPDSTATDIFDVLIVDGNSAAGTGGWAAGWITRMEDTVIDPTGAQFVAGPFIAEDTRLPASTTIDAVGPVVGVSPTTNSLRTCTVDWIELALVCPVLHPTRDLVIGQSGLPI